MLGFVKHTQPSAETSFTRLLAHFNDASMALTDERGGTYNITSAGQSTTVVYPKFGARSLLNAGGGGYFTPGPGVSFGTEDDDWCLEAWINSASAPLDVGVLYLNLNCTVGTSLGVASYNYDAIFGTSGGGIALGSWVPGIWQHVAVYRIGADLYGALDGHVSSWVGNTETLQVSSIDIGQAVSWWGWSSNAQGGIDELRYSVGTSRYGASNFTPPFAPFTLD